jgi:radical SAM superfamily enzyme
MHTVADFETPRRARAQAGLVCVAHAILGLPATAARARARTAAELARSRRRGRQGAPADGARAHAAGARWRAGTLELLDEATYVEWLADFVERLAPEQVLHRLTGDADADVLLAPLPAFDKSGVRAALARELVRRGTRQGSAAPATRAGTGSASSPGS